MSGRIGAVKTAGMVWVEPVGFPSLPMTLTVGREAILSSVGDSGKEVKCQHAPGGGRAIERLWVVVAYLEIWVSMADSEMLPHDNFGCEFCLGRGLVGGPKPESGLCSFHWSGHVLLMAMVG